MINKFLYISIVSFFVITISSHLQLCYASSKNDLRLVNKTVKQSAISFQIFKKEFIFTNSSRDFYRSFKRLIYEYNIGIPEEKLQEILIALTESEKDFVKIAINNLAYEANEYSYYRDNHYYQKLTEIILKLRKLNLSAAMEIALVDEYNKIAAIKTPYLNKQSNKIRYLHLLNQARYELVSAVLYDLSNIN